METDSSTYVNRGTDPTAADAEWKKIQQRTFTRWCNENLKAVNVIIYDLETDLCDGIKLILLLEALAKRDVGRYSKKPSFKSQKLENVAIGLKFIESENIKLVNIDASDIVKGNLKLILGLIWTLILKYAISLPMIDDDGQKQTPKIALLKWVQSKIPEVQVDNFTTDWNKAQPIGALVNAISLELSAGEPSLGLCPDWGSWKTEDAVENVKEVMQLADDWLGVPQVLDAADMLNPKVDEMSIMTYLSAFVGAKLRPGAPLRSKSNEK